MRWTCALALAGALVCSGFAGEAQAGRHAYRPDCGSTVGRICAALSDDGTRAVFPFLAEPLIEGAGANQIYARQLGPRGGGRTEAVFPIEARQRPNYGEFLGASSDVRHVFVGTDYPLAPEDADAGADVFDVSAGRAALLSVDPSGSTSMLSYRGASADGSRVFVETVGSLLPEDTDPCYDLYERSGGATRLVTPAPMPEPEVPLPFFSSGCGLPYFGGVSGDGTHVFFTTEERLVPEDEGGRDIYQRVGDTITLLTTYPERAGRNCIEFALFADASDDGRTVLFSTDVPISPEDHDVDTDVYRREPDGAFTLISRGLEGGQGGGCGGGDWRTSASPVALAADGGTAIFATPASVSPEDRDSSPDIYSRAADGTISLVTTGPTDPGVDETSVIGLWHPAVSDDARRVAFETKQPLVAADRDRAFDVYARAGGVTELVSTGPLAKPGKNYRADLLDISGDGLSVAFATKERLSPLDTDGGEVDFYLRRQGGRPALLSAEGIAPRMRIGRRGRLLGSRRAAIRLVCPRDETSGPCRGTAILFRGRVRLGRAGFRVAAGSRRWIGVPLRAGTALPAGAGVLVRVRDADALGNRSASARRVSF